MLSYSTILIPTYNEGTSSALRYKRSTEELLRDHKYSNSFIEECRSNIYRTLALLRTKTQLPILIVDDGSTDDTLQELERFQCNYPAHNTQLIKHKKNGGKGRCLISGLEYLSQGITHIIMTDADMVLPNGMFDILEKKMSSILSEEFGMRICPSLVKQSRRRGDNDIIADCHSGTRIIATSSRRELIQKHGKSNIHRAINRRPYSLETALNNLLGTTIGDTIWLSEEEKALLPYFLPGCRHYNDYGVMNEQIAETSRYYFRHIYKPSLMYKLRKWRDQK